MQTTKLARYLNLIAWLSLFCVLSVYAYVASGFFASGVQSPADGDGVYFDTYSVERGSPLKIYLHGLTDVSGTIYRLTSGKVPISEIRVKAPTADEQTRYFDYHSGYSSTSALEFDTSELVSGYYLLESRSESGQSSVAPFVVYDRTCEGIQIVAPTYTWLAYNPYIKSNYMDERPWNQQLGQALLDKGWWLYDQIASRLFKMETELKSFPVQLPYHKPIRFADGLSSQENSRFYKKNSHLLEIEWELLEFLELNDVDYCVLDDRSFSQYSFNTESDMLVFNGHSEYWSEAMLKSLDKQLDLNKKILFTGGNNIFRQVEEYEHGIVVIKQKMDMEQTTVRIGAFYDPQGYGTYAPLKILEPDHWLFDGIEKEEIGFETFKSASPDEPGGVSGHETDKSNQFSVGFSRLATGTNPNRGGADLMYRQQGENGWIINLGSLSFTSGIFKDPDIERIFTNIFLGDKK